jgi:hypothetical protein
MEHGDSQPRERETEFPWLARCALVGLRTVRELHLSICIHTVRE